MFQLPFREYIPIITCSIFASALGFVLFKDPKRKGVFTLGATAVGVLLFMLFPDYFRVVFSILMPTLVHVFIFTGLFILVGALKSGSKTGMASLIVFTSCALVALLAGKQFNIETVTRKIHYSYSGFLRMNEVLLSLYNAFDPTIVTSSQSPEGYHPAELPIFFSDAGIRAMRFIAFAYTYHYLNWFSKTSVIQWHNTKTINLVAIMIIWVASVVLYIIDYNIGLKWLFALSLGHVLLEFPLNHRSFIEVKQRLFAKFSG
ncbi:hypothetical protein ACLI1A_07565 [Flavobacterium sp. RHBU_3]|uniref:hypothetical protein n=1 Tax=Flavobacterium sp. RHBU_3 TaxID=3391184 RepID=UPI003984F781